MNAAASGLPPRTLSARIWAAMVAGWGAVTGIAPHVLHHVGPLAGAALLAGTTGRAAFAVIGIVAAIPFLLRLRSRFGSWAAPGVGLVVFAIMFVLSTFVVGPAISGSGGAGQNPGAQQPAGHAQHHT